MTSWFHIIREACRRERGCISSPTLHLSLATSAMLSVHQNKRTQGLASTTQRRHQPALSLMVPVGGEEPMANLQKGRWHDLSFVWSPTFKEKKKIEILVVELWSNLSESFSTSLKDSKEFILWGLLDKSLLSTRGICITAVLCGTRRLVGLY